jgi:hypothetical protein
MIITVSHFSNFAIVELAEGSSGQNGNNDKPDPTITPTQAPAPTEEPKPVPSEEPKPAPSEEPKPVPTEQPAPVLTETPNQAPADPAAATPSPTPAVDVTVVKDGETVSETGAAATYKVTSAADKKVAFTGDPKAVGKYTIKSTIKIGNDTYTVTSIENSAFRKSKITAVTIPDTVESIGNSAFEGCVRLKSVTIKGAGLKTIGNNAFKDCKVLAKFTIPKSVTRVGKQAFMNCKKLKSITVKSKKTKFQKNAFKKVPASAKLKLPKMTSKEKTVFKKMLSKTAVYKGKLK